MTTKKTKTPAKTSQFAKNLKKSYKKMGKELGKEAKKIVAAIEKEKLAKLEAKRQAKRERDRKYRERKRAEKLSVNNPYSNVVCDTPFAKQLAADNDVFYSKVSDCAKAIEEAEKYQKTSLWHRFLVYLGVRNA